MAPRPKNLRPGIPYQSRLNAHLAEIAQLRKTKPYPTPYKKIAEILKANHGLEISPNAIWAFVRNRALASERKPKYKLPDNLAGPSPSPPASPEAEPAPPATGATADPPAAPPKLSRSELTKKVTPTIPYKHGTHQPSS